MISLTLKDDECPKTMVHLYFARSPRHGHTLAAGKIHAVADDGNHFQMVLVT